MAIMTDFDSKENEFAEVMRQVNKTRVKRDIRENIRLILESPVTTIKPLEVDGLHSIDSYAGKALYVQDAMLLGVTKQALQGDKDAREFLMKYGGYTPPKEIKAEVGRVFIVDDLGNEEKEAEYRAKMKQLQDQTCEE